MIDLVISESIESIEELIYAINLLSNEEYSFKTKEFSNASIGEHVRHIFNFYESILKGIETEKIDYDKRNRDSKMETDVFYSISRFKEIIGVLINLKIFETKKFKLIQNSIEIETSLIRELIYANEHLVHHQAIIRIFFLSLHPEKKIQDSFGFAKSTLNYKSSLNFLRIK